MPEYHWGKVERIGGEFLRVLKREFECRRTRIVNLVLFLLRAACV